MCWGHATSTDLLTWEHHPVALAPDPDGPDSFGCWSGCVLVDDATGVATIHYTGVVLRDGVRVASIRRATSTDGLMTWVKDPAPVIDGAPAGVVADLFRDPHVTRDADGWLMLVGAGLATGSGGVLGWRSDDGVTWLPIGPVLTVEDVVAALPSSASEVDSPCWECPQLVRMGDRDVLIVSILERAPKVRPSHVMAFTGRLSGDRFMIERAERLGLGPDFYAPPSPGRPMAGTCCWAGSPRIPPARARPAPGRAH
jgi:beta-fructofuranosidase